MFSHINTLKYDFHFFKNNLTPTNVHVTGRSVKETIHMKGWGFNSIQVYNLLLNMKSAICLTVELSVLFNNL